MRNLVSSVAALTLASFGSAGQAFSKNTVAKQRRESLPDDTPTSEPVREDYCSRQTYRAAMRKWNKSRVRNG